MRLQLDGRPCEAWAEHGLSSEDSAFVGGYWLDTEDDLTDADLDSLNEQCADELYTLWLDHCTGLADDLHDRWQDEEFERG